MSVPQARTLGITMVVKTASVIHPPLHSSLSISVWAVPRWTVSVLVVTVVFQILLTVTRTMSLQAMSLVRREVTSLVALELVFPVTQVVVCRLAVPEVNLFDTCTETAPMRQN